MRHRCQEQKAEPTVAHVNMSCLFVSSSLSLAAVSVCSYAHIIVFPISKFYHLIFIKKKAFINKSFTLCDIFKPPYEKENGTHFVSGVGGADFASNSSLQVLVNLLGQVPTPVTHHAESQAHAGPSEMRGQLVCLGHLEVPC